MTKILDCTIRDGGHVNNWEFSDECILASLDAAEKSSIDYFEVGYTMPDCVKKSSVKLVLMINASALRSVDEKVDCVRVACYPDEIEIGMKACEDYHKIGYEVFLHLMTADKLSDEHYVLLKNWQKKDILTSIYYADSFGSFLPSDVEKTYNKLKNCGYKNISFHGHNNLQLAFANSIKAIELGAYSIDATTFGIGRGAGNLPIELLMHYFKFDSSAYLKIVEKYFEPLQLKYRWGYSYKNLIGGINNIHPREIDKFLSHVNV